MNCTKLDVAIVLESLNVGGLERVMVTFAEGLAAEGHKVEIVLLRGGGILIAQVPPAIAIVDLKARSSLFAIPALISYFRRKKAVSTVTAGDHISIIAVVAHRLACGRGPIVVTQQSNVSKVRANAKSLKVKFISSLVHFVYPLADRVVCASEDVATDLIAIRAIPSEAATVIYNPIVRPEIIRLGNEKPEGIGLPRDSRPLIVGFGRLSPEKNFPLLIDAFAILRKTREAHLSIIGDGPERARLRAQVSALGLGADVTLTGYLSNPYALVKASKVFALSSNFEGLPTVLVEAMALGVPVVATDCRSGPREILEGGRWGKLVPVGDADALASGIADALDGRLAIPSLAVLTDRFGVENAIRRYVPLLMPKFET